MYVTATLVKTAVTVAHLWMATLATVGLISLVNNVEVKLDKYTQDEQ